MLPHVTARAKNPRFLWWLSITTWNFSIPGGRCQHRYVQDFACDLLVASGEHRPRVQAAHGQATEGRALLSRDLQLGVEKATEIVVSSYKAQKEGYVAAMAELAMTGNIVSKEKFLEDEEATLRYGLRDLEAGIVAKIL